MMAGLLQGGNLLKRVLRGGNPPLAADGKTQTADTPGKLGKPKRRRAGASVDTILNDRLGGDR